MVVAGVGLEELRSAFAGQSRARSVTAVALVLGVTVGPTLAHSIRYTSELVRTDTRTEAFSWLDANVGGGAMVCREYFTPTLTHHREFLVPALCVRGVEVLAAGCDVVVTSSFMREAFERDPDQADAVACYRELETWRELVTFEGTPLDIYHDPTISIRARPSADLTP